MIDVSRLKLCVIRYRRFGTFADRANGFTTDQLFLRGAVHDYLSDLSLRSEGRKAYQATFALFVHSRALFSSGPLESR